MWPHTLPRDRYAELVLSDCQLLAEASLGAGLDAPVPTCPGWQLRELLRHLGHVHRWATRYVAEGLEEELPEDLEAAMISTGPDGPQLLEWLLDGGRELATDLQDAPGELRCWTFLGAPSPLLFWARRQANETCIHRVDGELAAGIAPTLSADLAADGIDELLLGFAGRDHRRLSSSRSLSIQLQASDTGEGWFAKSGPQGFSAEAAAGAAAGIVRGPVADLYLMLWNRLPREALEVEGSAEFLDWWRSAVQVTW